MNPETQPVGMAAPVAPQPTQTTTQPVQTTNNTDTSWYTSNPFLVSVRGLIEILQNNPVPALLGALVLFVLYIVMLVLGGLLSAVAPLIGLLVIGIAVILFVPFAIGVYFAIAAASAHKEAITTGTAMSRATQKLLPLIGLFILQALVIGVGFIFLIIPGLILLGRLALAPIALFEENLGPIAAMKRSFELTSGHLFEMLGALFAGGILGGGLLSPACSIAPIVGRYDDLKRLKSSGAPKPKVHWLNFLLPALIALFMIGYGALLATLINSSKNNIDRTNKKLQYLNNPYNITPDPNTSDPSSLDYNLN